MHMPEALRDANDLERRLTTLHGANKARAYQRNKVVLRMRFQKRHEIAVVHPRADQAHPIAEAGPIERHYIRMLDVTPNGSLLTECLGIRERGRLSERRKPG